MKKKILSLIAISAALVTAGGALVACDNGGDNVVTTVTEEQWKAALSVGSFENNFESIIKSEVPDSKGQTTFNKMTLTAGTEKYGDYSLIYTVLTAKGEKRSEQAGIRIVGTEKDAIYSCSSFITEVDGEDVWKDGEWILEYDNHVTLDAEEWVTEVLSDAGLTYIFEFADKFDNFEYKDGAYVLKGEEGVVIDEYSSEPNDDYSYSYTVTATDVSVKFVDGKLVSAELTMKQHNVSTSDGETKVTDTTIPVTVSISYGEQTINIPEDAVEKKD